jgi:hypothetical protein
MGFYSSRVNPAIVSRQEQRAFIPIYCKLGYVPYNAACAEALTADGRDIEEPPLHDAPKARLRNQALAWLEAKRDAWSRLLRADEALDLGRVLGILSHRKAERALFGVQDPAERPLAAPATERPADPFTQP